MAVYFIAAEGVQAIKIGCTFQIHPLKRLSNIQVCSPVRLRLAAVDQRGDYMTEAELLYRFRGDRLHGEWVTASEAVRAVAAAVAEGLPVPGGWYLPEGYPLEKSGNTNRGASLSVISKRFGMTRAELFEIAGPSLNNSGSYLGVPAVAVVRLFHGLRARGHDITFQDLLPDEWRRVARAPA